MRQALVFGAGLGLTLATAAASVPVTTGTTKRRSPFQVILTAASGGLQLSLVVHGF